MDLSRNHHLPKYAPGILFSKHFDITGRTSCVNKRLYLLFLVLLLLPSLVRAGDSERPTVASYTTSVEDQDQGVKTNLQLACSRLSGYVIQPRGVFSFNDVVGEASAKNGFAFGRVLYREEAVLEPGGGLCQVSTTLFNAFLLAGFNLLERHRHMQPVSYAPVGLDATIKYGKKNLRMKNPFNQKFYIETHLTERSLTILLKSDAMLPYRYEIVTEEEDVEVPILDRSRPVRQGLSIYVSRKRYNGSTLLDTGTLYKDYFPPVYLQ